MACEGGCPQSTEGAQAHVGGPRQETVQFHRCWPSASYDIDGAARPNPRTPVSLPEPACETVTDRLTVSVDVVTNDAVESSLFTYTPALTHAARVASPCLVVTTQSLAQWHTNFKVKTRACGLSGQPAGGPPRCRCHAHVAHRTVTKIHNPLTTTYHHHTYTMPISFPPVRDACFLRLVGPGFAAGRYCVSVSNLPPRPSNHQRPPVLCDTDTVCATSCRA